MKNYTNRFKAIAITASLFGIGMFLYNLCMVIGAVHYVTFQYDPSLSTEIREAIKKQVAFTENAGTYQPSIIMQELNRLFPHIKSVEIRRTPYHTAEIMIAAHEPIVMINNSLILTEKRTIIPKKYYACYALDCLPDIQMLFPISHTVSNEMMDAIHVAIKERIFDHFTVQMNREREWYLHDKYDPAFTVCCNACSLPTGMLHKTYTELKEKLKKNRSTKTAWMTDLRFNHQIVLSRSKGGHNDKGI